MRFRINHLSKLLGLSHTTIIYYEKKGIIHPQRMPNGYREYSIEDINLLKRVIILRNLGFSADEIENTLKDEKSNYEALLRKQSKKIKENIQSEMKIISLIDETLLEKEFHLELIQSSPFYVTKEPSCNFDHSVISDDKVAKELIRSMPFSYFTWFISSETILNSCFDKFTEEIDFTYRGISIEDAIMKNIDIHELNFIPSKKCVYVSFAMDDKQRAFEKIADYLREKNLTAEKQVIMRCSTINMIFSESSKGNYMELFIPVQ